MKYYTYVQPVSSHDVTPMYITLSEEEILKEYWDYWYERMCYKFGKDIVDSKYSTTDCIEDWIISTWAWEST
jgi:hypothetical protein